MKQNGRHSLEITDTSTNEWVTSLLIHRRFAILVCFLRLKINSYLTVGKEVKMMKRMFSILIALLFACSITGYSFAAEQSKPAAEQPKVEEKTPATDETKAKEEKQEVQQEAEKTESGQQTEQATAEK
jgi:amino acid permease